jgi:glyoxylase-like metal-dependent hydrolase (beta-lactamase superfamily II)
MTVTDVAPHLYQIVVPTPFPVGPINTYLAIDPAGPLTLVDTGPRTDQARAALEQGLKTLGYTLNDIKRIVITHAHRDHYGLAGDIVQESAASVYAHPRSHPLVADDADERARHSAFYQNSLVEAGVPQDIQETAFEIMKGYRHFASAVSPTHTLDEGDKLRLAGRDWQVLFMPGHTGGLICFYQAEERLFLSNDHLLRDISSNPLFEPPLSGQTQRRRSLVDYIASLERTAALNIRVVWPGHGAPIHDHRALIEERLAFHRHRADEIAAALGDEPKTVYAVSQIVFADLKPMDRFLAISEVVAHLEWLEDQGKVGLERENGLILWHTR